jgi:hypothetical protein
LKKKVRITEAQGFQPGSLHTMLLNMGIPGPTVRLTSAPGASPIVYETEMTQAQIDHFRLRGFSHRLEVEEVPVEDPRDAALKRANESLKLANEEILELLQKLVGLEKEIAGLKDTIRGLNEQLASRKVLARA